MKVGDVIKVYSRVSQEYETCPYGEKHLVPTYLVKLITVTHITQEMITALLYTRDGVGNVYWAVDYQGRQYRKQDHWDGPRATVWVRNDKRSFDQYPLKTFSRDLTGRGFIP